MATNKHNKRLYRQSVLPLILLTVLTLTACKKPMPEQEAASVPVATAAAETVAAEAETDISEFTEDPVETVPLEATATEDYLIATPYGSLPFPGEWSPFLHTQQETEGDAHIVSFFAQLDNRQEPQPLFSIHFHGDPEQADGAIKDADGAYVAVRGEKADFRPDETWTDRDSNIVYTMQQAMDYVLMGLNLEDPAVLNQSGDPQSDEQQNREAFTLDTPYTELRYPSQWSDQLSIEIHEKEVYGVTYCAVIGSHEAKDLFTVWFGGEAGTSLKTIKIPSGELVEIRIEMAEIPFDDSWTEEEKSTVFRMQEDANYLISHLSW